MQSWHGPGPVSSCFTCKDLCCTQTCVPLHDALICRKSLTKDTQVLLCGCPVDLCLRTQKRHCSSESMLDCCFPP